MRKTVVLSMALAFVLVLGLGSGFAGTLDNNGKLNGPHFQFTLIGHPKNNIGGDYSNGRAIMVPLKTENGPTQLVCNVDGVVIQDDIAPATKSSAIEGGVRLYFKLDDTISNFQISDRDALDGRAEILVPSSLLNADGSIKFDIYIRALGKPNTCMNINAYAVDIQDLTQTFYYAGSAYISRQTGKSVFVKANDLFNVQFCTIDGATGLCVPDSEYEVSVFSDLFDQYFWQILNDGSRNVQVRIYY